MKLPDASKFYYDHHNDIPEDMLEAYAKEAILSYAKWFEKACLPEEQQMEDWMIENNVEIFLTQP